MTAANAINDSAVGITGFTGTSFTGTTMTNHAVVLGGTSSSTLQQVGSLGTTGQVLTSQGAAANPIWVSPAAVEFPWTDEPTDFNAAVANGYFVTGTATATLPASPSQGDVIDFVVTAAIGTLTIQANTGQSIIIGANSSTTGGTAVNNSPGDSVSLVYQSATTTWYSTSVLGTWTLA